MFGGFASAPLRDASCASWRSGAGTTTPFAMRVCAAPFEHPVARTPRRGQACCLVVSRLPALCRQRRTVPAKLLKQVTLGDQPNQSTFNNKATAWKLVTCSVTRLLIQSTVCSQDPEPRVLDGWQDSMEFPPSMQYATLFRTTQHPESRNRQSSDGQTNRLIRRPGHNLLHWVFLRLKIRIEDRSLLCLYLFGPFLCLCFGRDPCLHLCRTGTGESHPSENHLAF